MAQLTVPIAGLLLTVVSQASDVVDRSTPKGFLSKYMSSGADFAHRAAVPATRTVNEKPVLHQTAHVQDSMPLISARAGSSISTKDFDPAKIADKEKNQVVQKLLANDSYKPITWSAIGVGLFSLVTMLGVHMRGRSQPATALASNGGLGLAIPINTASALGGNIMEMKSQGSSVNSGAEAIETIPSSPSAVPAPRRGEIGEEARDLDHAAAALWPTARRTALRLGAAGLVLVAAPVRAEEAPIDMDKIRELAAKKGSIDMSVPKSRDPLDKSLVEVVLGVNGAVIKLEPDELREMERVGFLVKDSFRGRAPEFWSLRDFTPRGWYSEPVDRFYGGLSGSPGSLLLTAAERSAANEERA